MEKMDGAPQSLSLDEMDEFLAINEIVVNLAEKNIGVTGMPSYKTDPICAPLLERYYKLRRRNGK